MPKKLTTPKTVGGTITDEEITSFTLDEKNGRIYVVYDQLDAASTVIIPDVTHLIEGAEMVAAIGRASEIAAANGGDVRAAIKQALYEYLPGNGTII